MKLIKFLIHPVLILFLFCLILVSGKSFGGFYVVYILMGLPQGNLHAIIGVLGVGLIAYDFIKYKQPAKLFTSSFINILGVLFMYSSLFIFFRRSWAYNNQTFEQTIPIISIIVFVAISLIFLIKHFNLLLQTKPVKARKMFI